MTASQSPEWPFAKYVFAIVMIAAFACGIAALIYPVYMYSLGH